MISQLTQAATHRVTPFPRQPPSNFNFDRQLLGNQLWELIAFVAKAGFFFLLTPVMVKTWGEKGYGLFAVAGSSFLFLGLLDFGVRPRLRIALSQDYGRRRGERFPAILRQAIISQICITLLMLGLFFVVVLGFPQSWIPFSPAELTVAAVTLIGAISFLLTSLLLEPIIARGRLGQAKMVTALGALAAVPAVWLTLSHRCSVSTSLAVWFCALVGGNVTGALLSGSHLGLLKRGNSNFTAPRFSLREGLYFNVSTFSWLAKTHLLTLMVALLGGVEEAGLFYVCLRLSEIISNFGAMSSDAAISGLAHATGAGERRRRFAGVVTYACFFSFQAAFAVTLLAPALVRIWWPATPFLSLGTACLVALFGLSMGLNRVISCTAFGLGLARSVAGWGALDGIVGILAGALLYPSLHLNGVLLGSCLGSFCLLPLVRKTLRAVSSRARLALAIELRQLLPWMTVSLIALIAGRMTGSLLLLLLGAGCSAALSLMWVITQIRPSLRARQVLVYRCSRSAA